MAEKNSIDKDETEGQDESAPPSGEHSSLSHLNDDGNDPDIIEVLDRIDDPEDREVVERYLIKSESSNGPYPPSGFILGYEQASKGLGVRVLEAAIRRVDTITKQIELDSISRRKVEERGQTIAALVALFYFSGCVLLVLKGHDAGAYLAGVLIVAVVVAFIGSSKIDQVAPFLFSRKPDKDRED